MYPGMTEKLTLLTSKSLVAIPINQYTALTNGWACAQASLVLYCGGSTGLTYRSLLGTSCLGALSRVCRGNTDLTRVTVVKVPVYFDVRFSLASAWNYRVMDDL